MTSPVQNATQAELARVFALQQAHQWDVKASTADVRKAKLGRLKDAVLANADAIVAAVQQDTRKPEGEIRVTEVLNIVGNIQLNIDSLEEWMAPTVITPSKNPADKAMIAYEARGVCLILGPWNFPLGLTLGPVAAAVAAGNCCMVKLSISARRPRRSPPGSSATCSTKTKWRCSKATSASRLRCSSCPSATSSSPAARESARS